MVSRQIAPSTVAPKKDTLSTVAPATVDPTKVAPSTVAPEAVTTNPTNNTIANVDKWSIVSVGGDPRVSVGQDPSLFVTVEMDFLLSSAEMATHVEVSIYPFGQCGIGAPVAEGTGFLCSNQKEACIDQDNGQVLFTASYGINNLEDVAGTLWDPENETAKFCGRVSLTQMGVLVSFTDMNFEFQISLTAGISIVDIQATPPNAGAFSKNFVYQVQACLCDDSNVCYSTAPRYNVGADLRVSIKPAMGEDVEILRIDEWKVEKELSGLSRYAIYNGTEDVLTSVEFITPQEVVVKTVLDAEFFETPDNVVLLEGLVLVQPLAPPRFRARARALMSDNVFQQGGQERFAVPAPFRMKLELMESTAEDSPLVQGDTSSMPQGDTDRIVFCFALLFLLLMVITVVMRQRYSKHNEKTPCNNRNLPHNWIV